MSKIPQCIKQKPLERCLAYEFSILGSLKFEEQHLIKKEIKGWQREAIEGAGCGEVCMRYKMKFTAIILSLTVFLGLQIAGCASRHPYTMPPLTGGQYTEIEVSFSYLGFT
jgi:hypothetical protein